MNKPFDKVAATSIRLLNEYIKQVSVRRDKFVNTIRSANGMLADEERAHAWLMQGIYADEFKSHLPGYTKLVRRVSQLLDHEAIDDLAQQMEMELKLAEFEAVIKDFQRLLVQNNLE